jgi:DNA (cytosine-5)-methyltransferase 1
LSVAGKRAGLQGSRSGLFWEIVRLLTETKAENFILENVPGLLSSNDGRDFGVVLSALDGIGFDVAWRVCDAQFYGVPQRRRRVFIVGCLRGTGGTPAEILAISEGRARYLEASKQTRKGSTSTTSDSVGESSRAGKIIDALTVSDLTKGMGSNQAVNSGLLQVVDVVD